MFDDKLYTIYLERTSRNSCNISVFDDICEIGAIPDLVGFVVNHLQIKISLNP